MSEDWTEGLSSLQIGYGVAMTRVYKLEQQLKIAVEVVNSIIESNTDQELRALAWAALAKIKELEK